MFYSVGGAPTGVITADFNADGNLDLAVTDNGSNNVAVLQGNGDGTFQPAVTFPVGRSPTGIVAADFNADGKVDLAAADSGANNVGVLLNTFVPLIRGIKLF